jgi:exodeoxyribonuclease V alpha subunit
MRENIITILKQNGILSELDIHFARFIARMSLDNDPRIFLAAALVSHVTASGNVCLDLSAMAEKTILDPDDNHEAVTCPKLGPWRAALRKCPAIGNPEQKRPLVLDSANRLYLYRYWEYEKILATFIAQRSKQSIDDLDLPSLKASIARHFHAPRENSINWQKIAAATAGLKKISVITGGPGTGKTFIIAKILAILLEQPGLSKCKIVVAAPTGKAAARLKESMQQTFRLIHCSDSVKRALPGEVYTIHRMLKPIAGSPYFHYNSENPLPAEVIVIDEASMVDLALMSKLVQAVPLHARLILIGDKDQLASVEAGSVMGDICDHQAIHDFSEHFCSSLSQLTGECLSCAVKSPAYPPALQDCIVVLRKSYRFSTKSGIGALSQLIKRGDPDGALALLINPDDPSASWFEIEGSSDFIEALVKKIRHGYSDFLKTADPGLALERFNRFQILCAVKIGPFGVDAINHLAEEVLRQQNLIHLDPKKLQPWYRGRPVMITANDYSLDLFNGDIGITLPDPATGSNDLYVFFPGADGEIRRFDPHRLPAHQTVYAMTIHKSQGSEFDEVILVLPQKDYPVLSRELVYTGLTRAKSKFSIWATRTILTQSILRKIERITGLREALWA